MTHTFTTTYHIRQYELNARNELPNSALARLFQETAMRGSADAGFGVEWYSKNNSTWVIHQLTIEHLRAIHYLDEIAITTWVSDSRRVFSHREYVARNVATNDIVARGRANWLHLNPTTMMPARVPTDVIAWLNPNGVSAVPRLEPRMYPAPRAPREFQMTRRVQRYEADRFMSIGSKRRLRKPRILRLRFAPLRMRGVKRNRRTRGIFARAATTSSTCAARCRATKSKSPRDSWALGNARACGKAKSRARMKRSCAIA
ncbi:MAG: hypothetical protein HZC40_16570 [Chloroflexi bacterium]|nr:hypothetical protein [Chloroflexota bacterium]